MQSCWTPTDVQMLDNCQTRESDICRAAPAKQEYMSSSLQTKADPRRALACDHGSCRQSLGSRGLRRDDGHNTPTVWFRARLMSHFGQQKVKTAALQQLNTCPAHGCMHAEQTLAPGAMAGPATRRGAHCVMAQLCGIISHKDCIQGIKYLYVAFSLDWHSSCSAEHLSSQLILWAHPSTCPVLLAACWSAHACRRAHA